MALVPNHPEMLKEVIESYDGERTSDGLPHGKGAAVFCNGGVYRGHWKLGHLHGEGTLSFPEGTVYRGDFQSSTITGRGTLTWSRGVYEGEVEDGYPHGGGCLTSEVLGIEYIGNWYRGQKHGNGTLTITRDDCTTTYTGDWLEDKQHGSGTVVYPSGNRYEGNWSHGKKYGHGIMEWFDRRERYEGEWSDDRMHGHGVHIWMVVHCNSIVANVGYSYEGAFVDGRRDGYGRLLYADGSIYEGQFSQDRKHGYGCFLSDGRCRFGELEDDKFLPDHTTVKLEEPISHSLVGTLRDTVEEEDLSEIERTALRRFLTALGETSPDLEQEEGSYIASEPELDGYV